MKISDPELNPQPKVVKDEIILRVGLLESAQQRSFVEYFRQSVKDKSQQKVEVEVLSFFRNSYIEQFVNSVNKKNKITIENNPRLIKQDMSAEIMTSLFNRDIDLALFDLSQLAKIVPEFSFLQTPRLFNNVDEVNIIWNSELGDYLRSKA